MKLKAIIILLIIMFSLLPFYELYKRLGRRMKPKDSFRNFWAWMITMLLLIFAYTFCIVLIIKLLFPGA